MHEKDVYKWVIFALLILHFIVSATMWIINDDGKSSDMLKINFSLKKICEKLKNNCKVYLLSLIIFGISILLISLEIFQKVNESYGPTIGQLINQKTKEYGANLNYTGRNLMKSLQGKKISNPPEKKKMELNNVSQ